MTAILEARTSARQRHAGDPGLCHADPASERLDGRRFPLASGLLGRPRRGAAARHRRCDAAHQSGWDRPRRVAARAFRGAFAAPGRRGNPPADRGRARLRAAARAARRGLLERRSRLDFLGHRHASRTRPVAERHGRPARARQGFQPRGPGGARLPQQAGIVAAHGFVRPGWSLVPAQRAGGRRRVTADQRHFGAQCAAGGAPRRARGALPRLCPPPARRGAAGRTALHALSHPGVFECRRQGIGALCALLHRGR